jgi:hypothetical protein
MLAAAWSSSTSYVRQNQLREQPTARIQIRGIGSGGKTCPIGTWHGLTKTWKNPGDVYPIFHFDSTNFSGNLLMDAS